MPAGADESPYNKGVEAWKDRNYVEARRQWERSLAEGGPDEALNNLGYLLYNGLGGLPRPGKAVELWRKGAALAVSESQSHLGHAYEEGRGVKRSLPLAYAWYQCAIATAGKLSKSDPTERKIEQSARERLGKLVPRLSESQRSEGERLSRELIAKYSSRLSVDKP